MKITSKGQVTIPVKIRRKLGLTPHSEVDFVVRGNTVELVRAASPKSSPGAALTARMRGQATVKMSTDEIMALTRGEESEDGAG